MKYQGGFFKKLFFFAGFLFLSSCVKDKPEDPKVNPPGKLERKVFIANEGSLGNGNASLSVYDLEKDSIYNKVYFQKNNEGVGDVLESLLSVDEHLFLAVNNSDKITVIDKNTFALVANIPVNKPRQMLLVEENKLYVSSLFYPEINIIDPKTFQKTGKISVDFPNTEGLLYHKGKVYAANWDTACNYIYEIDPVINKITHRIPIAGSAPLAILLDKNQKLWVLSGNAQKEKKAVLTQLDPESRSIIKSFSFPQNAEIIKPAWNPTKDTLYYLGVNYDGGTANNGVYRMSISAEQLPTQAFIAAQPLQYFWGLGIDSVKNQIYIGDPKGFIQNGEVRIYSTEGSLLKKFNTNLGPGYFLFD